MRANENLILIGNKVILVPYKPDHVSQYHEWMKSTFLQEMTASEPLTLEEEFEMQRTWHADDDKCTFIVLARPPDFPFHKLSSSTIKTHAKMIGDVNLFLNHPDEDRHFAEIEIMIAEEAYRRGGRGLEALRIMMGYALTCLDITTFQAKISLKNTPSVDLFTQHLGFAAISVSEVFQETTLEWSVKELEDYESGKGRDEKIGKVWEIRDAILEEWKNVMEASWD